MDTLYTARIHGFPPASSLLSNISHTIDPALTQESVLSLIVVLGSSVSLVALVFAFITYSLFSDLRSLAGTALINLLAALFMAQLLYVIGVGGVEDAELCMALSFSLQYMRLTVFCWLTAMTYDMYCTFRDNVSLLAATPDANTLGSSFMKYSLFGWGAPLVSLAASIVLQLRARGSLTNTEGLHEANCWFLDDLPCVYAFALPATALLITNVVYLIKAAFIARYTVGLQLEKRVREKMARRRRLQMWLFARVAIFVGLVSALGVIARLTHSPTLWAAFNVGSGLQGLVVALSVTCNCKVLKIYTRSLRRSSQNNSAFPGALKGAGGYGGTASEMAKSTSLQMLTWEPTPDAV